MLGIHMNLYSHSFLILHYHTELMYYLHRYS